MNPFYLLIFPEQQICHLYMCRLINDSAYILKRYFCGITRINKIIAKILKLQNYGNKNSVCVQKCLAPRKSVLVSVTTIFSRHL